MIKENQAEFDLTNVSLWQNDNLGDGVHIVVLDEGYEPFNYMKDKVTVLFADGNKGTGHGAAILATGYQIAPNARVTYMPFNSVKSELKYKMMDWILEHKDDIDLITMSISYNSFVFKRYFSEVIKLGIPFFSPTGNDGNEDKIDTPAKYPETIAVGATSLTSVDGYSNKGKEIDCVAPSHIYYKNNNGSLVSQSGTSISTPFVAYSLSLYLSWRKRNGLPKMNIYDVREFIKKNALDLVSKHHLDNLKVGHDYPSGWGLFRLPGEIPAIDIKPIEEPKEGDDHMSRFTDTKGHWAEGAIDFVGEKGLMKGYEEGQPGPADDTFRPNEPITRAELATVLARMNGFIEKK